MAFDFPASPTEGQEFTPAGGPTYVFNSPSWKAKSTQSLYVAKAGDTMSGDLTIAKNAPKVIFNRSTAAGGGARLQGQVAGLDRWQMFLGTSDAESTGNAGSDFALGRYSDAGAWIDNPLSINRSSAQVSTTGDIVVNKISPGLFLNKPGAGSWASLWGQMNSKNRWRIDLADGGAESGGNAGSGMSIVSYDDSGAFLSTALSILRGATAAVNLNYGAVFGNLNSASTVLDYYLETSFVPSVTFGGSSAGITYSSQYGYATRIGNVVHYAGRITLTSKGAATGTAQINGLPWAAMGFDHAHTGYYAGMASLAVPMSLMTQGTSIAMNALTTGPSPLTNAHFTNASDIIFDGSYLTS